MPHAVVNTAAGGPAGAAVARPMPRSQQGSVTPQTPKALPRASLPQAPAQGLPTLVRCSAGPGRLAGQSRQAEVVTRLHRDTSARVRPALPAGGFL
ncbi:hypothetical protein QJQ45_019994 [Haematococcus lacustris]|nr:hypothetical protein QJQ45_019994 [Haematococcus lacustris]